MAKWEDSRGYSGQANMQLHVWKTTHNEGKDK